jgi:sirohydrochlorin ferrochelatase
MGIRSMTRADAIIVVDHGSRREAANRMLDEVAALVQLRTSARVYPAHMELAEPTIRQAFDAAVADGAEEIVVFPYFLSPGRHSREDIPRMCAEAAVAHPGVRWHCTGPVGLDPMMADLIVQRTQHCEESHYRCDDCPDQGFCDDGR